MESAAILMGRAAQAAAETGEKLVYNGGYEYRGELREGDVVKKPTFDVLIEAQRRKDMPLRHGPLDQSEIAKPTFKHAHGLGVMRRSDGSVVYEGHWRLSQFYGLGVSRYPNGNIEYAGQVADGRQDGLCVHRSLDGNVIHAGRYAFGSQVVHPVIERPQT
eukprot:GHVU01074228.1.p3 GENE.GHVU01074228.1~~GHVU01074228.1.p3  ORF type:complete len:161 (-),score=11.18 GHVU01074228.1:713-1195(-)